MREHNLQILRNDSNSAVREEFLTYEELFLLSYLKEFDRKKLAEWNKKGLLKFV